MDVGADDEAGEYNACVRHRGDVAAYGYVEDACAYGAAAARCSCRIVLCSVAAPRGAGWGWCLSAWEIRGCRGQV